MSYKCLFLISHLVFVFCIGYISVLQKALFSVFVNVKKFLSVGVSMPECACGGQKDFVALVFLCLL